MQLRLGLTLALSVVSLAGCSSLAVNNGSLDYKETATLEPLKYPEGSMVRPATPLYPAPTVEALALEHAPVLENKRGNRFAMPRPQAAQAMSNAESTETVDTAVSRPQLIIDGNIDLELNDFPSKGIIKGDQKSFSIAAASIIAKIYRDRYMQFLSFLFPDYDWSNNAGYGTKKHIEQIYKKGITIHHRKSFQPIKSLIHSK